MKAWTPLREGEPRIGVRYLLHTEHVGERPAWKVREVTVLTIDGPTCRIAFLHENGSRFDVYPCELSEINPAPAVGDLFAGQP